MDSKNVHIIEKEIPIDGSLNELREANEAAVVIPERNLRRAVWTIVYGVALPCIPIIIICAILLYIIFHHQLKLNPGVPVLQIQHTGTERNLTNLVSDYSNWRKHGGKWAYHVRYNPSTITTIASWTSRIIPYLQSSIMALVAFFAARHIVQKSKHGDESQLPNPEQLTLLINTLSGTGFGPLKDVVYYRFFTKRGRLVHPLPAAISAFGVITIMALIIPVIDTWFGVATTAETVTQLAPNNSTLTYGRGISYSTCPNGPADNGTAMQINRYNGSSFWPCDVLLYKYGQTPVLGASEAGSVALGVSNTTKVLNYTDAVGNELWYLGSPHQNSVQDYQAKTLATMSQCKPMTLEQCNITVDPYQGTITGVFQCTQNFAGSLFLQTLDPSANESVTQPLTNVGVAFSGDAELTEVGGKDAYYQGEYNANSAALYPEIYTTNPLNYGLWAWGFPAQDFSNQIQSSDFHGDSAYYYDARFGGAWLLNCSTTVYEVTYAWVNGAVASFNTSLASTELAAMLSGPFALGYTNAYVQNALYTAATIAGSANNSLGIAERFATEYSKLLLAYSVGALEPQPVLAEQDREIIANIARVPLIPLYLLLATKVVYVLAVIILAIAAYAFTHPAETELVKDQLTVKGLTNAHFHQPNVMQEYAVKQLQSQVDATHGSNTNPPQGSSSRETEDAPRPILRHAATAPPENPSNIPEVKVGLLPAVDGTWQFVVKADSVWNSVKPFVQPIVKQVMLGEAAAGGLGDAGAIINAYHGK